VNDYGALPVSMWPELCPFLVGCLEASLPGSAISAAGVTMTQQSPSGALRTLAKLLEDAPRRFEQGAGPASFDRIASALIGVLKSPTPTTGDAGAKRDALGCLTNLVETMPSSLALLINEFLGVLSALAEDPDCGVRRAVCRAIVELLSKRTEYLRDNIVPVSQFILRKTSDPDKDVALEACEFWMTFGSLSDDVLTDTIKIAVQNVLPELLPTLIGNMVYPPEKVEEFLEMNRLEECQGEDLVTDLAPVFHKPQTKGGARKSIGIGGAGGETDDAYDGSDDDESDDDDIFNDDSEWTLRTCSAASLDTLAAFYPSEVVLPHLLPILQESLGHTDPWKREAGILALGAIAEGRCSGSMGEHMERLHPYLMEQLSSLSSPPQLRGISCWTLARYSDWAVSRVHSGDDPDLVGKVTEAVLGRVSDPHRKVQVAACSALGEIVERTGDLLVKHLDPIYRTLVKAIDIYQTRSLMVLFDTFGTMADFIGPAIGEGDLPAIYCPAILATWSRKASQNPFDSVLIPLMESLASIAMTLGNAFATWAPGTFEGAMANIEACTLAVQGKEIDETDAAPIVCATDLIDGLVEGLGESFTELVAGNVRYGQHFLTVLCGLVGHEIASVRMSGFALLGDLAKQCPAIVQDGIGELMSEAVLCMDPSYPSVCNNAVWAVGEVCVRCVGNPDPLQPYAADIVQNLTSLLMGANMYEDRNRMPVVGLAENAASTMGRLAKVSPTFVSPDLPRFLVGWCDGMSKIDDMAERGDAFEGFLIAVHNNQGSIRAAKPDITDTITSILFAIVSWHIPAGNLSPQLLTGTYKFVPFPHEYSGLAQGITMLLHHLKETAGVTAWAGIEKGMPVNVRRLMRESYNL